MRRALLISAITSAACAAAVAAEAPSYTKAVAPIFEANCAGCHATGVKMGKLDLDSYSGLLKGGAHGAAIVPGKSDESRLYLMITNQAKPAMPLSGKPLATGEIEIIKSWIDAGAQPPATGEVTSAKKPAIPDMAPRKPVHAQIGALAYSPDGKMLALGTFKEVRLVDPNGTTIATLPGEAEEVRSVAFSPDGTRLAAAGGFPAQSGEVKVWDVAARKLITTITGHKDCIYAVAFSPDGKILATSSYDKLIKLWNSETGAEIRTLKDHIDAIYDLAFTPDGQRLISASADRAVKIWDVASGQRLYTLSEPIDALNTIAIDPTGKFVAAGGLDKTIRVWSLGPKSGTLVNTLIAHEDAILRLAYSPDGKLLVSTAADKTLKVFRASDLAEVKTFPKQPDWILSLRFAPDGKHFACGRYDGSLAFFDTPPALPPTKVATR